MLASLNHPHIARLFDGGTTAEGLPYFVMEYVAGAPIDRYADDRRLNVSDRMRLCLDVFDAVQHAHDRQIIHRDLKPSNVLVTADGQIKLLDFGIAKWLGSGTDGDSTMTSLARPMTPEYASPEQVRGGTITPATDVYALGLLMYEVLTGHRPFRFDRRTPEEISSVVCELEPERPSTAIGRVETTTRADGTSESKTPITVSETREGSPDALRNRLSGPLDAIVMKALRKVPEARYPTVAALAGDVRRWLEAQPVSAGRDEWRYRASQLVRRHGSAIGVAAAVMMAIAITAVIVRRPASPPQETVALPAQTAVRPSVAVAGFTNLSQRQEDAWLSTAMVEMLTTELAGDGQLRVVPAERTTRAVRELGSPTTPLTDAHINRLREALATEYVVIGSFATSGEALSRRVRIDVRVMRPHGEPVAVSSSGSDAELFTVDGVGRARPSRAAGPRAVHGGGDASLARRLPDQHRGDAAVRRRPGTASRARCGSRAGASREGRRPRTGEPDDPLGAGVRVDRAWLRPPRDGVGRARLRCVARPRPRSTAECRGQPVQRAARLAEGHRGVSHVVGVLRRQRRVRAAPGGGADRRRQAQGRTGHARDRARGDAATRSAARHRRIDGGVGAVGLSTGAGVDSTRAPARRCARHAPVERARLPVRRPRLLEPGPDHRSRTGAHQGARAVRGGRRQSG